MNKTFEEELINNLAIKIEEYIRIIILECESVIPKPFILYLKSISDYRKIIRIEETGTISMFVHNGIIYFPKGAEKVLKAMKFIPGCGTNKNHKAYNANNLVENDNTYFDYIKHVFVSGLDLECFYQETLLHETMHICGADGSTALKEGLTELKTREVAKKYNLLTSGCGYPKESTIALQLKNIFGQEIVDQITFSHNEREIMEIIANKLGVDASVFYNQLINMMDKEFSSKYAKHDFPGITGPIKKMKKYDDINYDEVYRLIASYKDNLQNVTVIQ